MKYFARPVFFLQLIFIALSIIAWFAPDILGGVGQNNESSFGAVILFAIVFGAAFYSSLLLSSAGLIMGLVGVMKHKEESEYMGMLLLSLGYFVVAGVLYFST